MGTVRSSVWGWPISDGLQGTRCSVPCGCSARGHGVHRLRWRVDDRPHQCPESATPEQLTLVAIAMAAHGVLQLAFLPTLRASLRDDGRAASSRNWVRALLALCIVPTLVFLHVAVELQHTLLLGLSAISVAHATINDALIFGFLF